MNARTKKVVMILGVSSAILVWRVWVIISDYSPAAAQADQVVAEATELVQAANMPDPMAAVWEKQRSLEERPWGRNPFAVPDQTQTPEAEPGEEPPMQDNKPLTPPKIGFSGASRVGDTYRAILKSGIVTVGDPIEEAFTVKSIERNRLTIASGNWHYVYELGSDTPTIRRSGDDQ